MKIQTLQTHLLRNDAHFQFHSDFRDLVVRCDAQKLKIKPQFDEWLATYAKEDDALKKIVKSAITQQIQDADKARDDMYSAIVEIDNAYLKHYDPEVREAARRLKIVFDTYGNISRKPLKEQTSATTNILQELREKYAADCVKIKIDDWVDRLAVGNEILRNLMNERYDESAVKSGAVLKDVRRETDDSYKKICGIVNVYVMLEGAANYEQFIKTLNIIIVKYGGKANKSFGGSSSGGGGSSPNGDAGGGSHGGGAGGGVQYDPPLYDPNKHYTEYSVGDVVRLPDGSVWRVKDLGHIHYAPDSEYGYLGWERVY